MSGASYGYYYDPAGRLDTISPESLWLSYDGDRLASEINFADRSVARRYVFGPGTDEPLIWYEGAGTTDRRYLDADERGSIVRITDGTGALKYIDAYDEYGIPRSRNGVVNTGRFQYTGQIWLSSLGMYDYKARMCSPTLGRFLQTDPIGYGDGLNWYDYVGGNPVNATDPSGMDPPTLSAWTGGCIICNATAYINDGGITVIGHRVDFNGYADGGGDFGAGAFDEGSSTQYGTGLSVENDRWEQIIDARHPEDQSTPKIYKEPHNKPAYCASTLNRIGGAIDLFGKVNQGTAFAAIVLTGGAAAEGAAPAYLFGTVARYVGTSLQSFSGNTRAQADGIAAIFTLPAELSPVGDTVAGSAATLMNKAYAAMARYPLHS